MQSINNSYGMNHTYQREYCMLNNCLNIKDIFLVHCYCWFEGGNIQKHIRYICWTECTLCMKSHKVYTFYFISKSLLNILSKPKHQSFCIEYSSKLQLNIQYTLSFVKRILMDMRCMKSQSCKIIQLCICLRLRDCTLQNIQNRLANQHHMSYSQSGKVTGIILVL